MDKETVALLIAQNGLKTGATTVTISAALIEKKIANTKDKAELAKLKKQLAKKKKLAAALSAADAGLTQYLLEVGVEL